MHDCLDCLSLCKGVRPSSEEQAKFTCARQAGKSRWCLVTLLRCSCARLEAFGGQFLQRQPGSIIFFTLWASDLDHSKAHQALHPIDCWKQVIQSSSCICSLHSGFRKLIWQRVQHPYYTQDCYNTLQGKFHGTWE